MTKKYIVAAALALSLSLSGTSVRAAEKSVDLGVHVQQVIAEIHNGTADWQKMVGRIDRLVAHIDMQIAEGTGNQEDLTASRQRLVEARQRIQQQHLTSALVGEVPMAPLAAAPCEVCGVTHSAPIAAPIGIDGPAPIFNGGFSAAGGTSPGFGGGGAVVGGGGGVAGGGGLGGGLGGFGILGGIGAAIAIAVDDDDDSPGLIASPSTP